MIGAVIATDDLRNRLLRAGQPVSGDDQEDGASTEVWPTAETIVTIAVNLDPTLKPAYRERYFACYVDSEDNSSPLLRDDPAFALPRTLREAAAGSPAALPFLEGPFRWLARRMIRFSSVLLWPASAEPAPGWPFSQARLLEGLPLLRKRLESASAGLAEVGAVLLLPEREADGAILWEAARHVAGSFSNFHVSDPECREVYLLHHHDKVVASVPDLATRQQLTEELASQPDLFADCSGYVSDWDDEDEEDAP
ncbi:hypothetical protein AB1L88_16110 [Tautonia sp. JC769]|uniref:hypothetical protein n=1 Tax=Tautonia sp. JC769 TaxID=3232135 RepID=UPI00345AFAFD